MALRVPNETDPINAYGDTVARDTYIYTDNMRELKNLVYLSERSEWCDVRHPSSGTRCTRAKHPGWWRHVGCNGDYILRVWGGDEPEPTNIGELLDPEDGTPVDPAVLMTPDQIRIGWCVRLRDRENQLYVVGGVGKHARVDKMIEVLDLKKREFRLVPIEEVVPSEHVLTMDELSYTVEYVAHVRSVVKSEAVAMYRQDKWCRDGLQSALKDLGMSPHKVELHGDLLIRIPWGAPEGAVRANVERELKRALKDFRLDVREVSMGGNDPSNVIELDPHQVSFELDNVGRH